MKKKTLTTFLTLLILNFSTVLVYADNLNVSIPSRGKKIEDFIPYDWKLTEKAKGDLNKDKLDDMVIVIEDKEGKRLLLVLFQNKDRSLKLSVESNAVLCHQCGGLLGDPFTFMKPDALKINKGVIVIRHYGGSRDRWGFTHRFSFKQNEWYLIGEDILIADNLTLESKTSSANFLTGDVIVEKFGQGNKLLKRLKLKVKKAKLLKLSEFNIDSYLKKDISEKIKI